MDAAEIAHALGDARREGAGWRCRCPLADEHTHGDADPSFSVSDGEKAPLVKCWTRHKDEQALIIEALKVRGLWGTSNGAKPTGGAKSADRKAEWDAQWEIVRPIPTEAPGPNAEAENIYARHFGTVYRRFDYKDIDGRWLFCVYRFEPVGRGKEIRPMCLYRHRAKGVLKWGAFWPPGLLPLYRLEQLALHPGLPVLLVEGELKAELAAELIGDKYVVLGLPSGAKSVGNVDLTPLAGRDVYAWADNDEPGWTSMARAARAIEAPQRPITHSVLMVIPRKEWPVKYDVADLIKKDGWGAEQLLDFIGKFRRSLIDDFEILARKRFPDAAAKGNQVPSRDTAAELKAALEKIDELEKGLSYDKRAVAHSNDFIQAAAILHELNAEKYHELYDRLKGKSVRVAVWEKEVAAVARQRKAEREKAEKAAAAAVAKTTAAATRQWAPLPQTEGPPVDGETLIAEITDAIKKFVMLDETAALVAALWILFTWLFEQVAETNPFLRVVSPEPECGKSTLLKVLQKLVRSGWIVARITSSAFVRTMDRERRTLLMDEGDAFLADNEVMRNVLDGASDPDTATVSLSVKSGDDWTPVELDAFVPIAIASIGNLRRMQTVESRSITIHLDRATPKELKTLTKGRRRLLKAQLGPLALKCARWAADNAQSLLANGYPEMPEAMRGREQDKWEPLVLIADALGGDLGVRTRAAAESLLKQHKGEGGQSLHVLLLADLKGVFDYPKSPDVKISSKSVCDALAQLEDRPWAEFAGKKSEKPITPYGLANLLRRYRIAPHTVRLSTEATAKGYETGDFTSAWEHYPIEAEDNTGTPSPGTANDLHSETPSQDVTSRVPVGESDGFKPESGDLCDGSKNDTSPYAENQCGVVMGQNGKHRCASEDNGLEDAEIDRLARADGWDGSDPEESQGEIEDLE